jgi:hypothetical protein
MLTKHMADFQAICYLRARLKGSILNDLEVIRTIKRELIRERREIDAMKDEKSKKKAIEVYAKLLTTMELGDMNKGRARNPCKK